MKAVQKEDETMTNETVSMGKRIAQLRKDKGMTQEQLAEKLGVSAQAVSKWENDISCPDITLLPLLASTLGVTTDELLGISPLEPHIVVVEGDKKEKGEHKWSFDIGPNSKRGGIIFGCMLLLFGAIYLLAQFNMLPITTEGNFWWIFLCLSMLGVGISCFDHRFSFGGAALILFSGYLFYIKTINTEVSFAFSYIWPIAVVLIAVGIIVEALTKKKVWRRRHSGNKEQHIEYSDADGNIRINASFCDERRSYAGELNSIDIDASFGNIELDVSGCSPIANNCLVKVDISFGSLVLYVPEDVTIVKSLDNSFGSTSEHGSNPSDGKSTMYIKGDVSFGNVDIKRK